MLLPSGGYEIVEFVYKWGDWFRTLPFDWNSESRRIKLTKSWTKLVLLVLTTAYLVGLEYIFLSRLSERWFKESFQKTPTLRFHSLLTTVANTAFIQYQLCFILVYRDVPQAWNAFREYTQQFQKKYERSDRRNGPKPKRQWLVGMIKFDIYSIHMLNLGQAMYVAMNPDHAGHFDLGLLRKWLGIGTIWGKVSLDGLLCSLVAFTVWDIVVVSQMYFWAIGVLPQSYILEVVVTELSQEYKNGSEFRTRPELRLPGPFYRVSTEVILLAKLARGIASPMLVVLPANLILAMVVSGIQAIKGDSLMYKLVQSFNFGQLAFIFFLLNRLAGKFSEIFGKNMLEFCKHSQDSVAKKRVKALQVPTFGVYGIYTLGNGLIIDGFQAVLDNIVSYLALQ